jgi:phosphopantothenoylcysteine synthetase/decarboxylase
MDNIIIAISGGIAAYKAADIISALVNNKYPCTVKVIMTENAKKFITPLTLSTLSKGPVFDDFSEWLPDGIIKHIDLAKWADIFVIVPATANTISKISTGITDNLLTSSYLAIGHKNIAAHGRKTKIIICPAMNTHMWQKDWIQQHLQTLANRPNHVIIPPEEGLLACGDRGMGKLPSTRTLVEKIMSEAI